MEALTPRQAQVLACIREHLEATGYPPTRADIAQALGFRSANAAEEHLKALARKGAIEMISGASRGIRLVESAPAGLPLVGRVAAGNPILAEEHIDDYIDVPPTLFRPRAHYFLRVKGDSMRDAGILDGDWLAVHKTPRADPGQIVVARVDDSVTVKRLAKTRSPHVMHLLPENPDFEPIVVDLREQSLAIEGIAAGVLRRDL